MLFNLAFFDLTRTNIVGGTDSTTGVSLVDDEQTSRGLEFNSSIQFSGGLSMLFNYAYIDAEVTEGANRGSTPANAPEHKASIWGTYEFTDGPLRGLGLGGDAFYTGDRFLDINNNIKLGTTTLDATAFYYVPLSKQSQMRFQLGVTNLYG